MVTSVQHLKNHKNEIALLYGYPIAINDRYTIHCPTLKEIIEFGESEFFAMLNLFTIGQNAVDEFYKEHPEHKTLVIVDFVYYLLDLEKPSQILATDFLRLFLQTEVLIDCQNKMIYIIYETESGSENFIIDRQDFPQFQNILRLLTKKTLSAEEEDLSQITDLKVLNIKKKLREGDKIREEQQSKQGEYTITLIDMVSCISIYSGLSLETLSDYSYYAICQLYDRVREKQSYEEKFNMLIAGADIKDMSDWMMTKINK